MIIVIEEDTQYMSIVHVHLFITITHLKNSYKILQRLQIVFCVGTFQKCFDLVGELLPLLLLRLVPPLPAPGC